MRYQLLFGAVFTAALFTPIAVAQMASPDLVPITPSAGVASKSTDLKLAISARSSEIKLLRPIPATAAHFSNKRFFALSAAVYAAALADMHQTLEVRNYSWWYETDPLARPFVRLPAPAYYATGLAMATSLNWISWKMGRSRRWRKLSAVPQLLTIAGNICGFRSNR